MTRRYTLGAIGVGCVLGVLLAGCTSSGTGGAAPPSAAGPTSVPPRSVSPPSVSPPSVSPPSVSPPSVSLSSVSQAPTSVAPTSVAPTPSSATPSSSVASDPGGDSTATDTPPTAAPRSTCTKITIRVIRGSAAPGFEFAALQFVNSGSARCVLNGYPTVTLRRAGKQFGSVSQPAGTATSTHTLAPGATAESDLRDYSNCQAPLSDEIAVVAPGSSISTVRPGQLRGCLLRVSPLAAAQ